jgi:3-oxoacyl-[acyl-carrier protein] reductase
MKQIKNLRILVLGGSSDIAINIINHYLKNGYIVDAHFNSNSKHLEKLKKKNKNLNLIKLNFSKLNDNNYIKIINKKFSFNYSAYINLIGYIDNKHFDEINIKDLYNSLHINFVIPFFIMKFVIPKMLQQKFGRIINISSIGVKFGGSKQNFNYALSKYNLEFIPSVYKDWAKKNVLINCIRLGVFDTKMHKRIINKNMKKRINLIPIKRMGKPKEVVNLIDYLLSDKNSYLTGEIITLSGGE